jgi:DNA-binding PadR family transcriptional regulator
MVHDNILNLDSVIHAPVRLAALSILIALEDASFTFLKEETGSTDGNISAHLTKLEDHGFITVRKTFKGKKPQTLYAITENGREAFARHLEQLKQLVENQKNQGEKQREKQAGPVSLDFSPDDPFLD